MSVYWNDGTSLYHYGIPGQKWGVQNGPPYPLDASQKTATEKKHTYQDKRYKKEKNFKKNKYIKPKWEDDYVDSEIYDKNYKLKQALLTAGITALAGYYVYNLVKEFLPSYVSIDKYKFLGEDSELYKRLKNGLGPDNVDELFSQDVWDKFSDSETNAVKFYTGNLYGPINSSLRSGKAFGDESDKSIDAFINEITNAIDKSPLEKELVTFRRVNADAISSMFAGLSIDELEGSTFIDRGFFSSSPSKMEGQNALFGNFKLTTILPEGTKALYVGKESMIPREKELIVQRNSTFQVNKVIKRKDGTIKEIIVECINQGD